MDITTIISIVTIFVTFILGLISKRCTWISNHLIPVQNLIIGIIACVINYYITKDWAITVAGIGLFTGGTYDIASNLNELFKKEGD